MAPEAVDYKHAAVEQWSADPCGNAEGEPGTREYFERLVAMRLDYAPWMVDELDYDGTRDLDVLDVGSGQGIDLALYARAGARVTGIDLTPRHVQLARAHLDAVGLNATVIHGDGEALPFADASFDRVSSNGVLHHTPDMMAALYEIARVLRPGGDARIIVYNRRSFHYWLTQVLWHGLMQGRLYRAHSMRRVLSETVEFSSIGARPLVLVYSPRQLAEMLRRAGFVQIQTHARHFQPDDTQVTKVIARVPGLRSVLRRPLLDWLGRIGGWYLVGVGSKPTT
jgi:SAM-dependent methyltransferase